MEPQKKKRKIEEPDILELLYNHFVNYNTYTIDDGRIAYYNNMYHNNYLKYGDQFIYELIKKFINNNYEIKSIDSFKNIIKYRIKNMEKNYISKPKSRLETIFETEEDGRRKYRPKRRRKSHPKRRKSKSKKRKYKSRRKINA